MTTGSTARTRASGRRLAAVLALLALPAFAANKPFDGICYSPYHDAAYGIAGDVPDAAIRADLAMLKPLCSRILTYGTLSWSWGKVPQFCPDYGIDCYPGAYICDNRAWNEDNITSIIKIAKAGYSTTKGVIVGNEVLLNRQLAEADLVGYVDRVRAAIPSSISVGYADSWTVWLGQGGYEAAATLAQHCDVLYVHVYGFWDDKTAEEAADYVIGRFYEVQARYPGKTVVLGETGWPTGGNPKGPSVPGVYQQRMFMKRLLARTKAEGIPCFAFSAFDQPPACKPPGVYRVENHWGVYPWVLYTNMAVTECAPTSNLFFVRCTGEVSFAVTAVSTGNPPTTFQWFVDDEPVQADYGIQRTTFGFPLATNRIGPHWLKMLATNNVDPDVSKEWLVLVGEGDPDLAIYWPFNEDGRDLSGWGNTITIDGNADVDWSGVSGSALRFRPASYIQ